MCDTGIGKGKGLRLHIRPLQFDRSRTERCNERVLKLYSESIFPFSCRFCKDVFHFKEK